MSVAMEQLARPTLKSAPVLRSKLGRIVDLHHPLAKQLLSLQAAAQRLMNGPNAYRSAEFARWYKNTGEVLAEFYQLGLPPIFEDKFYRRGFGRVRDVLTDAQIFSAFKADMEATLRDLQDIIDTLEQSQTIARDLIAHSRLPEPQTEQQSNIVWQWCLGLAGLLFIVVVGIAIIV